MELYHERSLRLCQPAPAETTTVEVRIPAAWSAVLGDQAWLLEVLSLGMEEYRLAQALTLYRSGNCSLVSAAEQAGIPLRVVLAKARQRGRLPRGDEQQFDQDLRACPRVWTLGRRSLSIWEQPRAEDKLRMVNGQ